MNILTIGALILLGVIFLMIVGAGEERRVERERREEQAARDKEQAETGESPQDFLREPHERLAVEIVGQDVYDEKIHRATAGLYGGRRSNRYYGGSYGGSYSGDGSGDWDRESAILAAQQNLRIMREEDLNYAMADIESQILNMDHVPTEDELIGIADSAADYYDMSEDYQDY